MSKAEQCRRRRAAIDQALRLADQAAKAREHADEIESTVACFERSGLAWPMPTTLYRVMTGARV